MQEKYPNFAEKRAARPEDRISGAAAAQPDAPSESGAPQHAALADARTTLAALLKELPKFDPDPPAPPAGGPPLANSDRAERSRSLAALSIWLDDFERIVSSRGLSDDPAVRSALAEIERRLRWRGRGDERAPENGGPAPAGAAADEPPSLEARIRDLATLTKTLHERRARAQTSKESRPTTDSTPAPPRDALTFATARADRTQPERPLEPSRADAKEDLSRSLRYRALTQRIEAARRRLDERFEAGLLAAKEEVGGLRAEVDSLGERFDAAQRCGAETSAVDALTARVAAMTERLEAADAGFASVARLDRTIARLLAEIASGGESDNAGGPADAQAAPTEEETSPVLRRGARQEIDRRLQEALEAIHGTVGLIADRLGRLEADIVERAEPRAGRPPDRDGATISASLEAAPALIEPGVATEPARRSRDADAADFPAEFAAPRDLRPNRPLADRLAIAAIIALVCMAGLVFVLARSGVLKPGPQIVERSIGAIPEPPRPAQGETGADANRAGESVPGGGTRPSPRAQIAPERREAPGLFDPEPLGRGEATPLTRLIAGRESSLFEDTLLNARRSDLVGAPDAGVFQRPEAPKP